MVGGGTPDASHLRVTGAPSLPKQRLESLSLLLCHGASHCHKMAFNRMTTCSVNFYM